METMSFGSRARVARACGGIVSSLVLALSCTPPPPTAPALTGPCVYAYSVDVSALPVLRVQATFDPGGSAELGIADDVAAATRVEVLRDGAWKLVSRESGAWRVPECLGACTVRYEVALDRGRGGEDGVAKISASYLSPTYAWLLHPAPIMRGRFEITMAPPPPEGAPWSDVASVGSLRDLGGGKRGFLSSDFGEGSFTAFGKLRAHTSRVEGAELTAVLLDGALKMDEAAVSSWVDDAARCVATLYGRFPVPRASIFLVPIPAASEPVFGRVLSLGGSSVLVLTGEDSDGSKMHDDWILVHEMVHLGFPTFQNEGRWLDEGMATYYEPVLRTRIGWRDKTDLWRGLAREMQRGLANKGEPLALEKRTTLDGIYWGGALFVMMADVRIREATRGKLSLDDVVRGILSKGGDGEHVWTVAETMRAGDELSGTKVLSEMYQRYVIEGAQVDLEAELRALGVDRTGEGDVVTIHDDRPRSWIRQKIVSKDGR